MEEEQQKAETLIRKKLACIEDIQKEAKNDMILQMSSGKLSGVGSYTQIKIFRMLELLNSSVIDLDRVRALSFNGLVEDCRGLRSTVWKLILHHYPPDATQWKTKMEEKKEEYVKLRAEHLPGLIPLDLGNKDNAELWEDVEKDIKRTRPDVAFFIESADKSAIANMEEFYTVSQMKKIDLTEEQKENYVMTNGDILGRILYIYGAGHPKVRYVQGMNELLAVIYYLFSKDCCVGCEPFIESDAYFCFEHLMDEIEDWFDSNMDHEPTGIRAQLHNIERLIERNRKDLWDVMKENGVDINIFAIRWQMLLLCQDFFMPEVLRLWDSLLSDMARFNFFSYICLALIVNVEEDILQGEFDTIVKAVNNSPSRIEMKNLINLAKELLKADELAKI